MIDAGTMLRLQQLADAADIAVTQATKGTSVNADTAAAQSSFSTFWNLQTAVQSQGDASQQSIVNGLNARVHAAWGRLEDWLARFDDPSTWQRHSQTAMEAFNDAGQLAQAAGQSAAQATSYQNQMANAASAPQWAAANFIDTSYSGALKDRLGSIADTLGQSFLGIPVWSWVALAGGLVIFSVLKRD